MSLEKQQGLSNWSGDIRFTPAKTEVPDNEDDLKTIIQTAIDNRQLIRAVGAGHSCSAIFETDQTLIQMDHFKDLYDYDLNKGTVTVGAGMTVEEVGERIFDIGLGMENTGHINKQAIAGAVSTGTHGAGKKIRNLSGQVVGIRMVTGTGAIRTYSQEEQPEIMQALRVSLGSMGIFTRLTLRTLPRFTLHRRQYCASTDDCIYNLERLAEENRNFCFYWYPRRDDVSIRLWNFPGEGTAALPYARLYKEYTGWGKDVLPTPHELKYNELEYSLDASVAPLCFEQIRKRVKKKYRQNVAWRILYRPIAGDDAFLSNAYGKDIVAITIHQNAVLPYQDYFDDIEQIFREYGGRPHWGKKHAMRAADLQKIYPMWDKFQEIRKEFDPHGIFLNDYLKSVFLKE
jgi:FAD/FMN-containing dehydrogenase